MTIPKTYTHGGKTLTVRGWEKELGLAKGTFYNRLRAFEKGRISEEELFSERKSEERYVTHNGETLRAYEWAKKLGIAQRVFLHRLYRFEKGEITEDTLFFNGRKQGLNSRSVKLIEYNGESNSVVGWARKLGVTRGQMELRLKRMEEGALTRDAAFDPSVTSDAFSRNICLVEHNGRKMPISGWAKELGISAGTMSFRLSQFKAGKITEDRCFLYGTLSLAKQLVTYRGRKYTTSGLARKLDISSTAMQIRIRNVKRGKMKRAKLFHKGNIGHDERDRSAGKTIRYGGKMVSIADLAMERGLSASAISMRLAKGMSLDEAVNTPRITYDQRGHLISDGIRRNKRLRDLKRMGLAV